MSGAKHAVKVVKRDVDRKYVEVELDGERVRVKKFTEDDMREWNERMRGNEFMILALWTGYIDFDYSSGFEDAWQNICQRKALAIYRLLWYFGPPYLFALGDQASCDYRVKYKGYVFEITDEPGKFIEIRSLHLVTEEEFRRLETTDQTGKEKYRPSKEIRDEIVSIIECLTKSPVTVYLKAGPMLI